MSESGFNFREAHIMGSIHGAVCRPSRAMLMSGRSLYHVYDRLDSVATFPERMANDGYITFGTGKWHQSRESFARSFTKGRNILFSGMANHFALDIQQMNSEGEFSEIENRGFSTDLFADAAIDFIEDYAQADTSAPFLAYVSFSVPHDPRTPKPEFMREEENYAPLPENFLPIHPFHNGWMTGRDEKLAGWPREPEVIRSQLTEYYGLIDHMDTRIGDILGALDVNGLRDNTIIIFSSDNGLAMGSHGLLGKQSLYEHSNRVPLIISGPGIPAGETDALVMLYDLLPTIADFTGFEVPDGVDGQSLYRLLQGQQESIRDEIYTTYEDLHRSVRDERWKLIRYPRLDREQLFDLQSDPLEMNDLSGDPAFSSQADRLRARMEVYHTEFDDPHPLYVDSLDSEVFDYSTIVRTPDRWQPQWVIDTYFD
ncbi:MAG: sulfatase-like hydrolase/transferase [Bacteroidetes Order II. Incertae sedis bacterium]|nr:sulfatase-like hydrolase/transferase [Bacteroidetes Order II. bacterium]MBT4052141.1 sulfatase-like hydrolase/transferase [Bacteroidetes Order II. bacterium]MBT7400400.1 sulfatase-like hydrolase/transferase [Bacteroidetes Order II. bacterium]